MTTPEAELKTGIRRLLDDRGAFWCNIAGGRYAKPGDPDIIACVNGRFLAIEAKSPDGRQSDVQAYRQKQIEAAGGVYVLARSVEDVAAALAGLR